MKSGWLGNQCPSQCDLVLSSQRGISLLKSTRGHRLRHGAQSFKLGTASVGPSSWAGVESGSRLSPLHSVSHPSFSPASTPSCAPGDSVQRPVWKPLHTTVQVQGASESQPIVTGGTACAEASLMSPNGKQSTAGGWRGDRRTAAHSHTS